jgi:hypothetical protein
VEFVNELSLKQKRQLPHDITFYRGVCPVDDDEGREALDEDYVEDVNVSPLMIRRAENVADTIPMEFDVEDTVHKNLSKRINTSSCCSGISALTNAPGKSIVTNFCFSFAAIALIMNTDDVLTVGDDDIS